jgi:hypothetical protein
MVGTCCRRAVDCAISIGLVLFILFLCCILVVWSAFTFNIFAKWPSNVPRETAQRLAVSSSTATKDFSGADYQSHDEAGNC